MLAISAEKQRFVWPLEELHHAWFGSIAAAMEE
jgi:hypothetical protein